MTANTVAANVLAGRMDDLPALNSQIVRIFTSSTFTDTVTERNMLMEHVYPKLREYCRRKHGLEFQVVDMRWGVRDEAADDHMASSLCLQEIQNCQRVSVGPNFVTFLGQRHGYRPFPAAIESSELEMLMKALEKSGEDTKLPREWFLQDTNSIPAVHILQPISSKIPGFLSEDDTTRLRARTRWTEVFTELQRLLRFASKACCEQGKLTEEQKHKYFMSVTESEVYQGVFLSPGDPNAHCLCFVRIIDDMEKHLSHRVAWRFIDMIQSDIDEEAQHILQHLRDEKVVQKLQDFNVVKSVVNWSEDGGINGSDHREYLKSFSKQFLKSVKSMIEKGLSSQRSLSRNELCTEVLQHLQMANERCQIFCGRKDLLEKLKASLLHSAGIPVVVYGTSGCGKTSVMAKSVGMTRKWIENGENAVVIARFLGTSPASCDIRQVLQTVCSQIAANYEEPLLQVPQDINDLVGLFSRLLKLATADRPLVLILDSLDQLSSENYAHRLAWLPRELPEHVHCIVSTLPDEYEILDTLEKKIGSCNFVEVPILGDNLSLDILGSWLKDNKRTLTGSQMKLVKNAFEVCSLPLYVKLVFEEVINWRSYMQTEQCVLASAIREVISNLFHRIEKKHGSVLVKHSLAYLTASRGGLSESELEDILSLDDVVLTDVFQYHVPPVRRMPLILWLRIKNDISTYLVSREADNTTVAYWYHRQFIQAARDRYLRGIGFTREANKNLAEFFSGQWHGKQKPFTYTEAQTRKLGLISPQAKADRKVAAQPTIYLQDSQGNVQMYNKRKMNNLPLHMARGSMKAELKKTCLFNFEWLSAKLEAVSLQHILADLELLPQDAECKLLCSALNHGRSTLGTNPATLAQEILGRLLPYACEYNKCLRSLLQQCYEYGPKQNALVPRQQCFPAPGGSLKYTFENSDIHVGKKLMALSPDSKHAIAVIQKNRMLVWDLNSGEMESEVKLLDSDEELDVAYVDSRGEHMVVGCAFHKSTNPVVVINTTSREVVHSVVLQKLYPKIGFRDSYKLHLADDKLIVHVHMRAIDCFEIASGRLLWTFCEQATNCHVMPNGHNVLLHQNDSPDLEIFDTQTGDKTAILPASDTPLKCVTGGTIGNVYVAYRKSAKVDEIGHYDEGDSYRISNTLDLATHGHSEVQDLSVSHDESLMLLTTPTSLVVWNMFGSRLYRQLNIPPQVKPKHRVTSFIGCITPDMRSVVCAYNEFIIMWNILHGRLIRTIHASVSRELNALVISSDSSMAVTTSERNKTIKVWDLLNVEEEVHFPLALSSAVRYMTTGGSTENPLLLLRTYDPKETRVLDVMSGDIISAPSREYDVMAPYITNDGKYAVLRGLELDEALKVWDTHTGKLVCSIPVSSLYLRTIAASTQSTLIATHCESSPTEGVQVSLWKLKTGEPVAQLPITKGGFAYMFFLNQDRYMAMLRQYPQVDQDQYRGVEDDQPSVVAGKKCTVVVYDVIQNTEVLTLENVVKDSMYELPGGRRIVLVEGDTSGDKLVCIDVITKNVVYRKDVVPTVRMTISKDGSRAVDTALQVFSMETGDLVTKFDLSEHVGPLMKQNSQTWPRISADGAYVAWLLVREGMMKVGRVEDGQLIGSCFSHSTLMSLQMCGNRMAACGCDDGRVMLLHIVDHQRPDEARKAINTLQENTVRQRAPVDMIMMDGVDGNGKEDPPMGQMNTQRPQRAKRSAMCHIV